MRDHLPRSNSTCLGYSKDFDLMLVRGLRKAILKSQG